MNDRGQAIVETALSLSILVFLLIGGADFARVFAAQVGVVNSARVGAEAHVLGVATTEADVRTYVAAELGGIPGIDVSVSSLDVRLTTPLISTVSYTSVEVVYQFRTLVPWPFVPNQTQVSRTVLLREP